MKDDKYYTHGQVLMKLSGLSVHMSWNIDFLTRSWNVSTDLQTAVTLDGKISSPEMKKKS